jgi:hypothetical protein
MPRHYAIQLVEVTDDDTQSGTGAVQPDGVNVLRYVTPAKWAAILAGTSTDDLAVELQAALTAEPNLIFPDGLFRTSQTLTPRPDARIRGVNRRGPRLRATAAVPVLEFPYLNTDCVVENIRFQGPAGYTGIGIAATAGAFQGYFIRPLVKNCDFDYATGGFGINADCIYAHIDRCTFGFYSEVIAKPAIGEGSFCGLRSFVCPLTSNYTNLNVLEGCVFDGCGNLTSATAVACDLSGGTGWTLRDNDFSFGGVQIRTNNIQALKFEGTNWFEGNNATSALVELGLCTTPVDMTGVNWSNNNCDRLVQGAFDGTTKGLVMTRNEIAKSGATYVLFDTVSLSRTLPGNGAVAFYDNSVNGGAAGDKCVTGTEFRGGKTSPRLVMCGDTTDAGSITDSNDPGLTIYRNGVGDVSIIASHPFATAKNKIRAIVTGQAQNACRVLLVSTNQIRVQLFTDASIAADGVFSLVVYGS